jgi:2,4-dienoyl-CoA reductase-like NADH-dependent reductase (Old Yellow Enzyme family)
MNAQVLFMGCSYHKKELIMKTLRHLLEPIKIGPLQLSNRLVMPPMGTGLADAGLVSEANLAYIKRWARSGAGLIITEITAVHQAGHVSPCGLGAWDDKFIPGLSKMAKTVHSQSAKVALQLHHCGRESYTLQKKKQALSASAIPSHIFGFLGTPREMRIKAYRVPQRRCRQGCPGDHPRAISEIKSISHSRRFYEGSG